MLLEEATGISEDALFGIPTKLAPTFSTNARFLFHRFFTLLQKKVPNEVHTVLNRTIYRRSLPYELLDLRRVQVPGVAQRTTLYGTQPVVDLETSSVYSQGNDDSVPSRPAKSGGPLDLQSSICLLPMFVAPTLLRKMSASFWNNLSPLVVEKRLSEIDLTTTLITLYTILAPMQTESYPTFQLHRPNQTARVPQPETALEFLTNLESSAEPNSVISIFFAFFSSFLGSLQLPSATPGKLSEVLSVVINPQVMLETTDLQDGYSFGMNRYIGNQLDLLQEETFYNSLVSFTAQIEDGPDILLKEETQHFAGELDNVLKQIPPMTSL